MKLHFSLDRVAAFRTGTDTQAPTVTLEVDPAALSEEDRALLAGRINQDGDVCAVEYSAYSSPEYRRFQVGNIGASSPPAREGGKLPKLVTATAPTLEGLLAAIRAEDAAVAAKVAEAVAAKEAEQRARRDATLAVLTGRKTASRTQNVYAWRGSPSAPWQESGDYRNDASRADYALLSPNWPYSHDETVTSSPEALAWRAELDAQNDAARREAVEKARQGWLVIEAKKVAEAERAAARQAQIDAWVEQYGTEGQKARHAEGLLPEKEVVDAMREEALAPLAGQKRYEKITASEVCECEDRYDEEPCGLDCEVTDPEGLTDEQFTRLVEFRRLLPGAEVEPRLHTCTGKRCEAEVSRLSLLVTVTVGAFAFSREYAL